MLDGHWSLPRTEIIFSSCASAGILSSSVGNAASAVVLPPPPPQPIPAARSRLGNGGIPESTRSPAARRWQPRTSRKRLQRRPRRPDDAAHGRIAVSGKYAPYVHTFGLLTQSLSLGPWAGAGSEFVRLVRVRVPGKL